jgi:hypothetical protein
MKLKCRHIHIHLCPSSNAYTVEQNPISLKTISKEGLSRACPRKSLSRGAEGRDARPDQGNMNKKANNLVT